MSGPLPKCRMLQTIVEGKMVVETFEIFRVGDKSKRPVATLKIKSNTTTSAEQNIVVLNDEFKAVAVIEIQSGYDRRQIASELG